MSWPTLSDGKFLPLATLMDNVFKVCFQAAESAVCWHTIRETWIENPRVQMFAPLPSLLLLPKFDIQPQQPCLYALLVKPLYLKPISVALQERQTGNRYIRGWGVIPISLAVGWTGRSTDTYDPDLHVLWRKEYSYVSDATCWFAAVWNSLLKTNKQKERRSLVPEIYSKVLNSPRGSRELSLVTSQEPIDATEIA